MVAIVTTKPVPPKASAVTAVVGAGQVQSCQVVPAKGVHGVMSTATINGATTAPNSVSLPLRTPAAPVDTSMTTLFAASERSLVQQAPRRDSLKVPGQGLDEDMAPTNCEMHLDSGISVRCVAPAKYMKYVSTDEDICWEQFTSEVLCNSHRQLSTIEAANDATDRWEGMKDLCQAVDAALEIDNETGLFVGKRVLEIGFCTGAPSAFAYKNGAAKMGLHAFDARTLKKCVKPTLRRNGVPLSICKFTFGDYPDCSKALDDQDNDGCGDGAGDRSAAVYDVILAPEAILEQDDYEPFHDVFDSALSTANGLILLTVRTHYEHSSGSLASFIDFVKHRGRFDPIVRWTSPKQGDIAPRKVLQMTRR